MEADDSQPSAGPQQRFRGGKASFQLAKLVIDVNAQGHERAGRRIDTVFCVRQRIADNFRQLQCAVDLSLYAGGHDGAGDTAGVAFLA
jgi:hypothetical protein